MHPKSCGHTCLIHNRTAPYFWFITISLILRVLVRKQFKTEKRTYIACSRTRDTTNRSRCALSSTHSSYSPKPNASLRLCRVLPYYHYIIGGGARGGGWQGEGPEGEVGRLPTPRGFPSRPRGSRLAARLASRLASRASPGSRRVSQGPSRLRVRLPMRLRLRFRLCGEMRFPETERETAWRFPEIYTYRTLPPADRILSAGQCPPMSS